MRRLGVRGGWIALAAWTVAAGWSCGATQVPGAAPRDDPKAEAPRGTLKAVRTAPPTAFAAPAQGRLDLELAIARADLIMAVRLLEVSETKIVHGGKQEQITQQFRFEPVRVIKGVFAREALILTGEDLGVYRFGEGAEPLPSGQMLLVILGRNGPGYFNCNTDGVLALEESLPRLRDQDDPLLASVEILTAVTQERDRARRASMLLEGLKTADGRAAAPLLRALQRRSVPAVQTSGAVATVARLLADPEAPVRAAAAEALGDLLQADYLVQREARATAAEALVEALRKAGPAARGRVAAWTALAAAGTPARENPKVLTLIGSPGPISTFAEQAARFRLLGELGVADQLASVARTLTDLPLDAPPDLVQATAGALTKLDPHRAATILNERLARKSESGLDLSVEIELIGGLPKDLAAPALSAAFGRGLTASERAIFAAACVKAADPRLVPMLADLLDPRWGSTRFQAIEALRAIDTDDAAKVVWPHMSEEPDLGRKLELAEFVGRHGFRGGYAYAIEHMSEPALRAKAVDALAAIREPKALPELRRILERSRDRDWNAAAIEALGRLGESALAPKLLPLVKDLNDPLAPSALLALADLGELGALPSVTDALSSRSDLVVMAAARAAVKLLKRPMAQGDAAREKLAALLADPYASQPVRAAALEALVELDDPRLGPALAEAVRDAGLEGGELLAQVERRLADRKQPLRQP